ncbi:uncharacterized protein LOC131023209 [Salvia miltiorrhiza]|uniref:uncharacterized protein LOC131023209 n=1 Tax=Salvia miltiorrhiza TaxID=226208 RepID=UPI0025AC27AE|nr:uncharacterized protein LOC131023209 [Salvia miltiorrhiza]
MTEAEEVHWKQRSRSNWHSLGDRNSKYFHAFASKQKKNNTISSFTDKYGSEVKKAEEMAAVIHEYFVELFASNGADPVQIDKVTNSGSPYLGESSIGELDKMFTESEIRKAIFQIYSHKAPGPDGYLPLFSNDSKVLANRLRTILNSVIDDYQCAFIPERLISDNIILGYECMHWIRGKKNGKEGVATAKLDMSKAYDRVKWRFLRAMMVVMRFSLPIINLVMQCISMVVFSFVINHKVYGNLIMSRGLRQGCPLSSFLFVICAQGFSSLIRSYENQGLFNGITMARYCLSITNLFFADDSLVFFKATKETATNFKVILEDYGRASGQVINFDKPAITFSPNTKTKDIGQVTETLGIKETQGHSMYLGLPTFVVKKKTMQFYYIRDRVYKKISTWDHKFFSSGGKEVLIKSVIQSIPTYAMSCFRLPADICYDIERCCANFWWGDTEQERYMHWTKWKYFCKPKSRGGLGFRQLIPFNQALLAKQAWRILKNMGSLLARVLKHRYFREGDLLTAKGRDLLAWGNRWKVGDGLNIKAFKARWILGRDIWSCPSDHADSQDLTVADFIERENTWDSGKLKSFFPPFICDDIASIQLSGEAREDRCYWSFDERERYVVKSSYLSATNFYEPHSSASTFHNSPWWKRFWALQILPKIKHFAWKALNNFLAMDGNLARHHVPVSDFGSRGGTSAISNTTNHRRRRDWTWFKGTAFSPLTRRRGAACSSLNRPFPRRDPTHGTPLPNEVLRLDVDVAHCDEGRKVGVGFLLRNSSGSIIAAGCQPIGFTETVILRELHAMLIAIGFCLEHDFGSVVLYSDSLLAIHLLQETHHGSDSLCDDLWEAFQHVRHHVVLEFFHARREANRAAHELARFSVSCQDVMIWKSDFPIWLRDFAFFDIE